MIRIYLATWAPLLVARFGTLFLPKVGDDAMMMDLRGEPNAPIAKLCIGVAVAMALALRPYVSAVLAEDGYWRQVRMLLLSALPALLLTAAVGFGLFTVHEAAEEQRAVVRAAVVAGVLLALAYALTAAWRDEARIACRDDAVGAYRALRLALTRLSAKRLAKTTSCLLVAYGVVALAIRWPAFTELAPIAFAVTHRARVAR